MYTYPARAIIFMFFAISSCAGRSNTTYITNEFSSDDDGGGGINASESDATMLNTSNQLSWAKSARIDLGQDLSAQYVFATPGYYTIQFAADTSQFRAKLGGSANLVADITWSTAGNQIVRRISPVNGMSISGLGEGVQVRAYTNVQLNEPLEVILTMTEGSRPTNVQPPTYQPYGSAGLSIPASNAIDVPIPLNVGAVAALMSVWDDSGTPPKAPLTPGLVYFDQRNSIVAGHPVIINWTEPMKWVPLATGADQIHIYNAESFPVAVNVLFAIDG
jgi:hypothetical protein